MRCRRLYRRAPLLELRSSAPSIRRRKRLPKPTGRRATPYVVRKNAPPQGVDLGPAAPIDRAIEALRRAVRDRTRTDVSTHARAVHDLLMRRHAADGDVSQLLVSPDGALNLVPFEALVDEQGRYLIERFSISYLTSGRDLLRQQGVAPAGGPPVIVADPSYGEPARARRSRPAQAAEVP